MAPIVRSTLYFVDVVFVFAAAIQVVCGQSSRRRKPAQRGRFVPTTAAAAAAVEATTTTSQNVDRISIANMTCYRFEQPLNHFDLPRNRSGTYQQRYCVYNEFVDIADEASAPVFLYTGNESPLETYVNHTGLLWELASQFSAQVVFVEHRYEGQSLPDPHIPHCMAYASSIQALADYARFVQHVLFSSQQTPSSSSSSSTNQTTTTTKTTATKHTGGMSPPRQRRPVIAFGGSYGGMLSAWLRHTYPSVVAGAIAASAPIFGLPLAATTSWSRKEDGDPIRIDAAARVIAQGLQQPYPPTTTTTTTTTTTIHNHTNGNGTATVVNHCGTNLLAAWPLIRILGGEETGRELLTEIFRLCRPLEDADLVLDWAQSPWFDLAEGSFPYPSSYIPYALTHQTVNLPAWPLQAACWTTGNLHQDFGIAFVGNVSNVDYNITFGDSDVIIAVDWDNATAILPCCQQADDNPVLHLIQSSSTIRNLLESVRDAISIWFNATKDASCYELTTAPNSQGLSTTMRADSYISVPHGVEQERTLMEDYKATSQCQVKMTVEGSWPSLCCNEEMNLIIADAVGMGRGIFWPPTFPRNVTTYAQVVEYYDTNDATDNSVCDDPDGMFGYPPQPRDPWSTWYETVYGGRHIQATSNIVFSNGLLDPWSAAGVYAASATAVLGAPVKYFDAVPGLIVQNITSDGSVIAVIMELGGHHTDLMYADDKADPPCIREARRVERDAIATWIKQFWENEQQSL